MNCHDLDELIIDYLYGELDSHRQRELDDHLANCTRCTNLVKSYQQTRGMMAHLEVVGPGRGAVAAVLEAAATLAPAPWWRAMPFGRFVLHPAVATSLMAMIILSVSYLYTWSPPSLQEDLPALEAMMPPPAPRPPEPPGASGLTQSQNEKDSIVEMEEAPMAPEEGRDEAPQAKEEKKAPQATQAPTVARPQKAAKARAMKDDRAFRDEEAKPQAKGGPSLANKEPAPQEDLDKSMVNQEREAPSQRKAKVWSRAEPDRLRKPEPVLPSTEVAKRAPVAKKAPSDGLAYGSGGQSQSLDAPLAQQAPMAAPPPLAAAPAAPPAPQQESVTSAMELGNQLYDQGNYGGAVEQFRQVPSAEGEFALARSYKAQGRMAEALEQYRRFIARYPSHGRTAQAYKDGAYCLERLGRLSEAEAMYAELAERFPSQSSYARRNMVKLKARRAPAQGKAVDSLSNEAAH